MSQSFDQEILLCFLDEAADTLVAWERACLDLEKQPSPETFNALFRAAHNLKGSSRAVGLEKFGEFVHVVEDFIQLLMKGALTLTPLRIGLLLESQVVISEWIEGLRGDVQFVPHIEGVIGRIKQSSQEESASTVAVEKKETSATALTPEQELEQAFLEAQRELEGSDQNAHSETSDEEVLHPSKDLAPRAKLDGAEGAQHKNKDETIRVAASKLDELIQLIGELSIHQAIVYQAKRDGTLTSRICQNAIHLSNKITKDLHTKALSLRMQPVHGLFQRLERVARDVARLQGKKVEVIVEGTEVELDKTVIERITDPLIHIIRNAIDHGIESPDERVKLGKGEAKVSLIATQDAAGVCLKVCEDGKGLNAERILQKAREKGLISPHEQLSQDDIHKLIFLPGFSTAEKVTDISGRGVGMDVVMKAVQSLQGAINISSTLGKGTEFSITLPTSLSIVDALVVTVDEMRYAIPMHELTEIIDLESFQIESTGNRGRMVSLRGDVVPLATLKGYLPVKNGKSAKLSIDSHPALVVREGPELVAFEIDGIVGQQQIVVRPLSEQLSDIIGFNGCTILGDGEPGMIISLGEIARSYLDCR